MHTTKEQLDAMNEIVKNLEKTFNAHELATLILILSTYVNALVKNEASNISRLTAYIVTQGIQAGELDQCKSLVTDIISDLDDAA